MQLKFRRSALLLGPVCALIATLQATPSQIMTLEQALSSAYYANPTMNAQRAATRVTDELVPQALAGYRPKVQGNAEVGIERIQTQTSVGGKTRSRIFSTAFKPAT